MSYVMRQQARAGFTLIEILIAVAILAVLAVTVGPNLLKYISSSKETATQTNLQSVKLALNTFNLDMGDYPDKLRDLIKKPTNEQFAKKWKMSYLDPAKMPVDGWGRQLQYKKPGEKGHPYELYSYGPNGKGSPRKEWISVWD